VSWGEDFSPSPAAGGGVRCIPQSLWRRVVYHIYRAAALIRRAAAGARELELGKRGSTHGRRQIDGEARDECVTTSFCGELSDYRARAMRQSLHGHRHKMIS